MSGRPFPQDFAFGVATSAYQVEGGIENDWSQWEREGRLKDPEARCGRAVDHWNRYEEDLRLAGSLGCNAFRVSLEWARIEPERGRFDEEAIAAYQRRLGRMRQLGLQPVVTLHHFTHPSWFHRQTPWHESSSVESFGRYASACARILEGQAPLVIPINEPMVLLLGGYLEGVMPPGLKDAKRAMRALEHLVRAHLRARAVFTDAGVQARFGTSQNVLAFAPDRFWHPLDRALVRLGGENYNHAFLRAVTGGSLRIRLPGVAGAKVKIHDAAGIDFVGLNYYSRVHLRFTHRPPFFSYRFKDATGRGLTDLGWEVHPEGLTQLLLEAKVAYGLPLWITENGIDDRRGDTREGFLHAHWSALLDAVDKGAQVEGYLHWSLLDNFEWLEGWGPRFGLFGVDLETMERSPTAACDYFRRVATSGVLTAP